MLPSRWSPTGIISAERCVPLTCWRTRCILEDLEQSSPSTSPSLPSRNPATHEHSLCPAVGLQRGVQPGTNRFFMELVDLSDAATLVPTIQRYIRPNNHIWSDKWPAYNGCVHQTVNHSQHYVDPATGSHTKKLRFDGWRASPVSNAGTALHATYWLRTLMYYVHKCRWIS